MNSNLVIENSHRESQKKGLDNFVDGLRITQELFDEGLVTEEDQLYIKCLGDGTNKFGSSLRYSFVKQVSKYLANFKKNIQEKNTEYIDLKFRITEFDLTIEIWAKIKNNDKENARKIVIADLDSFKYLITLKSNVYYFEEDDEVDFPEDLVDFDNVA